MAEVASRWIENGAATEFTHWHRQEASWRIVAKEILPASLKQTQPSSYHLWLKLPDNWQADKFIARAKEGGGCGGAVRDEFQHRYFFARRGGASLSGTAG